MRRVLLLLWLICLPAWGQDAERGKLLYETHCGVCHYERVHQRLRSDIKGLADLRDTVAKWAAQTRHRFTLDEIEDVVQYLNASHYRVAALPPRELIYGAELMSAAEREQYRREAAAAGGAAAADRFRERHRQRMRERARERGVRLAEPAGIVAK